MQSARVLTVSDGVAAGEREDLSGPALCERLRAEGFDVEPPVVVSDGIEEVAAALRDCAARHGVGGEVRITRPRESGTVVVGAGD